MFLNHNKKWNYTTDNKDTELDNEIVKILILNNNDKFELRIANSVTFKDWTNSTVIKKFFNNYKDLRNYLKNEEISILDTLLENLSNTHAEFVRSFM